MSLENIPRNLGTWVKEGGSVTRSREPITKEEGTVKKRNSSESVILWSKH
jgi:hypothetical protein